MSNIRSKNTKFERLFIKELRKKVKSRFRTNDSKIKGKPDIVFREYGIAIFLDSDFWHGWQYPRWKHLLKNDFWRDKIAKNRSRDKKTTNFLKRKGWLVIRFWEHKISRNIDEAITVITDKLKTRKSKFKRVKSGK